MFPKTFGIDTEYLIYLQTGRSTLRQWLYSLEAKHHFSILFISLWSDLYMVWLNPTDYKKQEYMALRLNAPLYEYIRLDFNPLKISDVSGHELNWKDWHYYRDSL